MRGYTPRVKRQELQPMLRVDGRLSGTSWFDSEKKTHVSVFFDSLQSLNKLYLLQTKPFSPGFQDNYAQCAVQETYGLEERANGQTIE
jgi:hypothetical protein